MSLTTLYSLRQKGDKTLIIVPGILKSFFLLNHVIKQNWKYEI